MNFEQFLADKNANKEHEKGAIKNFIEDYMKDIYSDKEMAAWLKAVYKNDLNFAELCELTEAMAFSGEHLSWPEDLFLVDKHSTGGVGDKTTLIITPIVASLGIPMVKLSGKGLGHTGGTVDKLLSIPHLTMSKTPHEILEQVREMNLYIGSQTKELAPADKRIYALREKTDTIDNIALIASSIVSKKIASGANAFVFDVKVGKGAFMPTLERGRELGETMIKVCEHFGRKANVVLSSMDEPLGNAIGNQLEVLESMRFLKNEPVDANLKEICLTLAAQCIVLSEYPVNEFNEAYRLAEKQIENGQAYRSFVQMVQAQSGNLNELEFLESEFTCDFFSLKNGIITEMNALTYGKSSHLLGAGITANENQIDPAAGILLNKKVGDEVFAGENIARLYYDTDRSQYLKEVLKALDEATKVEEKEISLNKKVVLEII